MYHTCVFCTTDLGGNEVIETFPVGRRLAFDANKGRLWVVCRACERWNLSPLDERWEAVEDCERRFRDARKRFSTDNIGLARLNEGLELVRIGEPLRPEFAAWRYGDQFGKRRRKAILTASAVATGGVALAAGALVLGAVAGVTIGLFRTGDRIVQRVRDRRVVARIPTQEGDSLTVLGQHLPFIELATDIASETGWKLVLPHADGSHSLRGEHALLATSLIMPAINGAGGSPHHVDRAIRRLEAFADPVGYLRSAAAISSHATKPGPHGALKKLPVDMRLAIEMAANEENEQFALAGEMWLLEWAWQEAEQIAAIADSLTVPAEVERQLEELRRRHH